jgi:hypothetical protein
MANLVRLKQVDQPELSGYIVEVTDLKYYPVGNPSGYLSSISSDSSFTSLSGQLYTSSGALNSKVDSVSGVLSSSTASSGVYLEAQITTLSGHLNTAIVSISGVSDQAIYAQFLATGFQPVVSGALSGERAAMTIIVTGTSGQLNTKISTVSGNLNSRIASLETNFATTGSNFVDLISNSQTILGTKTFSNRIGFKQIDILPHTGNYTNPGGEHGILFTQFIDQNPFYASGLGTITGDFFVTKLMQPNNIECIISSMIYTGAY